MEEEKVIREAEVEGATAPDGGTHKAVAILGYILPILFFIPMLSESGKKDAFAMFHANQHVILLIAGIALGLVNIIPILGQIVWLIGIFVILWISIMGIINAAKGEKKEIPLIGHFRIL